MSRPAICFMELLLKVALGTLFLTGELRDYRLSGHTAIGLEVGLRTGLVRRRTVAIFNGRLEEGRLTHLEQKKNMLSASLTSGTFACSPIDSPTPRTTTGWKRPSIRRSRPAAATCAPPSAR